MYTFGTDIITKIINPIKIELINMKLRALKYVVKSERKLLDID